jgi:Luciferase-like monooxygenase
LQPCDGVYVPTFGEYDVLTLAALANEAERVGWDGFFVWDHLFWAPQPGAPLTDTTVALTAIALATGRVRFGALVTALARRRPWKLAKEAATLFRVTTEADSPRRSAWTVYYDPAYGLTLSHAPTWFRARQSLTPQLADPVELVALATFPPGAPATGCAQFPTGALEKLGSHDAVVSLQERSGEPVGFRARIGPFRLDDGLPSEAADCLDEPSGFVDRLIPFADGARPFYAYVAVGNEAEPATLDEALGILNTLRVARWD